METVIGYKMLRSDGTSLRKKGRVDYRVPRNGKPGPWIEVPGNGAYVAVESGLTAGGVGPLVVLMECDPQSEVCDVDPPYGVRCFRRVRVRAVVDHITWPDGMQQWCHKGRLHRDNGPAVIWPDGTEEWWREGLRHREDGPALIFPDGREEYWREGRRIK